MTLGTAARGLVFVTRGLAREPVARLFAGITAVATGDAWPATIRRRGSRRFSVNKPSDGEIAEDKPAETPKPQENQVNGRAGGGPPAHQAQSREARARRSTVGNFYRR